MASGGKRAGAGRPKGALSKVNQDLRQAARKHTVDALKTLVAIAKDDQQAGAARVSAACAILDRGHGKPVQANTHEGLGGGPIKVRVVFDDRDT